MKYTKIIIIILTLISLLFVASAQLNRIGPQPIQQQTKQVVDWSSSDAFNCNTLCAFTLGVLYDDGTASTLRLQFNNYKMENYTVSVPNYIMVNVTRRQYNLTNKSYYNVTVKQSILNGTKNITKQTKANLTLDEQAQAQQDKIDSMIDKLNNPPEIQAPTIEYISTRNNMQNRLNGYMRVTQD